MSVAIITGSAGLVGSEAVAFFASLGLDVVGIDNGMRAEFFRPGSIHKLGTQPPRRRRTGLPPLRNRHSRRMRDRDPLFSVWPEDRLGHPHSRATIPRLGGQQSPGGLHGQRQRNFSAARGDAALRSRGSVHLHVHKQSVWGSSQ